jgi:excisionase family DNA binding protein
MPVQGEFMTTAEAAETLGLTLGGLHRAIADGRLKVIPLDARTNVVERSEVERYRREHLGRRGRPRKS